MALFTIHGRVKPHSTASDQGTVYLGVGMSLEGGCSYTATLPKQSNSYNTGMACWKGVAVTGWGHLGVGSVLKVW